MTFTSVPVFVAICYIVVFFIRKTRLKNEYLPLISMATGCLISVVVYLVFPEFTCAASVLQAAIIGIVSGGAATGVNQSYKQCLKAATEKLLSVFSEDDNTIRK